MSKLLQLLILSSGGHMWLCDGFKRSFTYSEDCTMAWGRIHLHMNWGWGGTDHAELNGWYGFNGWNPGNHTFNYKRGMVYNINL